jgi:hypothetical protein
MLPKRMVRFNRNFLGTEVDHVATGGFPSRTQL